MINVTIDEKYNNDKRDKRKVHGNNIHASVHAVKERNMKYKGLGIRKGWMQSLGFSKASILESIFNFSRTHPFESQHFNQSINVK